MHDKNGAVAKRLWSYIKDNGRKDNFGVASLRHNGNAYNDNQTKAQLLNNYFTSVFISHSSESLPVTHDSPFPDIITVSVDANGVLKLLNELDVSLKLLDQIKYLRIF